MYEDIAEDLHVICRDCGHAMELIQQQGLDEEYFVLVTCWQSTCLLRGFTLSIERYQNLSQTQLEVYRDMNRLSHPHFVRVDNC